jgi:hypothetical protein
MFAKQFASWVSTLFVVGLAVAAIFAQVRVALFAELPGPATAVVLVKLPTAPGKTCHLASLE